MTPIDHIFLIYTGLIIGVLCGLFPLILSISIYFDKNRQKMTDGYDTEEQETIVNNAKATLDKPADAKRLLRESAKKSRELRWKKRINWMKYNSALHFWVIFISLILSLVLIALDVCIREHLFDFYKHSLSLFLIFSSIVFFAIALGFLFFIGKEALRLMREN